jgi:hypothetical protein
MQSLLGLGNAEIDAGKILFERANHAPVAIVLACAFSLGLIQ